MQPLLKLAAVGAIGYLAYRAGQKSRIAHDGDETLDDADASSVEAMPSREDDERTRTSPHGDPLGEAVVVASDDAVADTRQH